MYDERDCYHVLVVEDNPGDVGLIRRALAQGGCRTELHVTHDGPEALEYLARCHGSSAGNNGTGDDTHRRPDLILLDLSLPKIDGCELLTRIKADARLLTIPIVILSSSQAEQDVVRSYEHGANCFITKPLDLERYMAVVGSVQRFWLARAQSLRNATDG
jgi:two-component system, chemotaxis family, response regulator Rcp1